AGHGDRVEFGVQWELGALRGGEEDRLAVGRPTVSDLIGGIEGQPFGPAAHHGYDEHIIAAVTIGAEGDVPAIGAKHRENVGRLMHGHRPGDAADGLYSPDITQVAESDEPAVRRDVRSTAETDWLLSLS